MGAAFRLTQFFYKTEVLVLIIYRNMCVCVTLGIHLSWREMLRTDSKTKNKHMMGTICTKINFFTLYDVQGFNKTLINLISWSEGIVRIV